MNTNILKGKCRIYTKSTTTGALGNTETWTAGDYYWTRRIPVDVQTKTAYQQLNTVVTDKFLFDGTLELSLGQHRVYYGGKYYEMAESAMHHGGQTTVLVSEV